MLQCFSGLNIAGKAFCSQKFPSSSSSSDCAQMTCRLVEHYVPTRNNIRSVEYPVDCADKLAQFS